MPEEPDVTCVFSDALAAHAALVAVLDTQRLLLEKIARMMSEALQAGNKILWCGNGGSAADAQHLAAELVGRFRRERRGFASIALTTDTSVLTSVANDYGYDTVFARQVEALGVPGDVLVGISTSGGSVNVLTALEAARHIGLTTIALTGAFGARMAAHCDCVLTLPSNDTARIQEAHILVGHMLCDWIEQALMTDSSARTPVSTAA